LGRVTSRPKGAFKKGELRLSEVLWRGGKSSDRKQHGAYRGGPSNASCAELEVPDKAKRTAEIRDRKEEGVPTRAVLIRSRMY